MLLDLEPVEPVEPVAPAQRAGQVTSECSHESCALCLCTWQLFVAQAEQLPGALLHHAARPACLLGTRVTTAIPPNCPGTNTLPRALIRDRRHCFADRLRARAHKLLVILAREADSSNAFASDLGSWTVARRTSSSCVARWGTFLLRGNNWN